MSSFFCILLLVVNGTQCTLSDTSLWATRYSLPLFAFFLPSANEVAKVMFLHLCVSPQGGLPQCMLGYHPPLGAGTPPSPGAGTPSRRLLLRTVRILLECILVEIFV